MLKEQLVDVLGTLDRKRTEGSEAADSALKTDRARTLEEVGKKFDVTRERIRQIEAKALQEAAVIRPEARNSRTIWSNNSFRGRLFEKGFDMIKLSDRLQIIAERIKNAESHGRYRYRPWFFASISILQSGQCDRVILADISVPSLAKAEENCSRYFTGEYEECAARAEFRVGDGLTVLKPGEVDAVVIAGVGGKLITELLERDMEHTCSFRKYVFQPRIGQGILRKWLCDHGFHISSPRIWWKKVISYRKSLQRFLLKQQDRLMKRKTL